MRKRLTPIQRLTRAMDVCAVARGEAQWMNGYRAAKGDDGSEKGESARLYLEATGGTAFPGFFQANPPREREHITQKPLEIMQQMLRIVPEGGLVLDPFAGSGTTLRAAKDIGRRAIGVEQTAHHCASIAARLSQSVLDLGGAA